MATFIIIIIMVFDGMSAPGQIAHALAPFSVKLCSVEDRNRWDAYLADSPAASFYHCFDWVTINQSNFGHNSFYLAAVDHTGTWQGVLPLVFIESRLFGKILASLPFVNYGGPISQRQDVTQALLAETRALASKLQADYVELRSRSCVDETLPTALHKVSMSIDLDGDADSLWASYSSKHRTNIRRVYKNDITVKHGGMELLEPFYELLSRSWRRLGTPIYHKRYFSSILSTFPDNTRIFIAYKNAIPASAAFNGYYGGTVEGMWAAADPEFQKLQPNYVLYWEMIKHACDNGQRRFHLGRSTVDSNAEQFKKKWNAHPQQLYWQYILNKRTSMPALNVNNPKFDLAIRMWRQLPIPVTKLLGPLLAKSIP